MKSELIVKLGTKLMDAFKYANYRRGFKVALLVVPVVLWDVFFYVVKKLYEVCSWLDEKGGKFLQDFVEK